MARRGMEQVGVTLERTLKRLGLARRVRERMALVIWGEVVGAPAARNTRPVLVRRGELLVQVSSSTWAQELSLMRAHLVARLNDRLGGEVIRDIRFAVDPALARTRAAGGAAADVLPVVDSGAALGLPGTEASVEWEDEGRDVEIALGSEARRRWYRVRAAAARRRQELVARGWKRCSLCGSWADPALVPAVEGVSLPFLCPTCHHAGAAARVREAALTLRSVPWISEQDLAGKVSGLRGPELRLARQAAADAIREDLRQQATGLLEAGPRADWTGWRARAQELVLVATGLPLARIGEDEMKRALGDLLPLWQASRRASQPQGK